MENGLTIRDNSTEIGNITIAAFFTQLSNDKADSLIKGLFGIYIDANTTQHKIHYFNKNYLG